MSVSVLPQSLLVCQVPLTVKLLFGIEENAGTYNRHLDRLVGICPVVKILK